MDKKQKVLLAAGSAVLGTGAIYLGVGKLVCYNVLSKKACNKHPEELLHIPDNMRRYIKDEKFRRADDWYNAISPDDTVLVNSKGDKLLAKIIKNDNESHKWLIAVHGYTSRPRAMARQAIRFYENGYNIIMPCQRAHRNQEEKYTSMGYYERYDIISWINYIISCDPYAEIVLLGISMGSATVMLTTGENLPDNVKCCIADCGYSNCKELFRKMIKKETGLPAFPFLYAADNFAKLFLGWSFNECAPIKAVAKSKTPTLFIHGTNDDVVPYYMVQDLFSACNAEKEFLSVNGVGHDEACEKAPDKYWEAVDRFLSKYA